MRRRRPASFTTSEDGGENARSTWFAAFRSRRLRGLTSNLHSVLVPAAKERQHREKKKREKKKIGFCRKRDRGTSGITCELQLWCYLRRRSHTSNPCSVSGSFKRKEAGTFWGFYRPRGRGWRWHHTFDSTSKEGRKGLQSASHHLQSLRKQNNHSTTFSFCLVVQPQVIQNYNPTIPCQCHVHKTAQVGEKKPHFHLYEAVWKGFELDKVDLAIRGKNRDPFPTTWRIEWSNRAEM